MKPVPAWCSKQFEQVAWSAKGEIVNMGKQIGGYRLFSPPLVAFLGVT